MYAVEFFLSNYQVTRPCVLVKIQQFLFPLTQALSLFLIFQIHPSSQNNQILQSLVCYAENTKLGSFHPGDTITVKVIKYMKEHAHR